MAELVGGAFLSASLQVLFDRMASRDFLNLFKGQKHNDRLLVTLKDTLQKIKYVVDDADNKQFTDSAVKDWLVELQDVVYHADDLLDEIATHEAVRREFEAEGTSTMNPSSLINMSYEEMESKLEYVIERLDVFAKHKDDLGLKHVTGQKFSSDRQQSTSLVGETDVYGREDEKEKIINLLLSDDESKNQISVIPIVGMGGIGKTTLAQLVYNDDRVENYFDKKAWVCVSERFDILGVTKTILQVVMPSSCDINDDLNRLQEKLKQSLNQQKFLLVLDDVWSESPNDWNVLKRPLTSGTHGSKVIVTTRIQRVASIMQTIPCHHHVRELTNADCWSLFSKCAFENGDSSQYPNLEVIGKKIVKKCGGLPLAAKALGGLLRSNEDVEEWEYIWKSEIWHLQSDINPALRLSYQYLPSSYKRCFAYCSTFPKDYEFGKEELVLLWMANSLLVQQPKSKITLEDEGAQCFRELLSRSFFQHSVRVKSKFVMHDLIHDLAEFVAGEFFYRLDDEMQPRDISEKVRHFSYARGFRINNYSSKTFDVFMEINNVERLRSFLPFDHYRMSFPRWYLMGRVLHEMLPKLRCLRVLSLSNYFITELPDSIANLIHLRLFNVSYTNLKFLPESITTLYNLQTLLLTNCRSLTKLPQHLRKLISLRRLDICGTNITEMPIGMDQLKSLQFLSTFVVGNNSGSRINALGKLNYLQKTLSILGLENVLNDNDALEANLKDKKHLEDLVLQWNRCTDNSHYEPDVLDKLQPHRNLKNLTIKNYGGDKLRSWLREDLFCNMISLTLEGCGNCFILPQLGQLRSLKFLTIIRMNQIEIVGPEFFGDDSLGKPFQSLEVLKFIKMIVWEQWYMLDAGEFSCLKELCIIDCPKLTGDLPNRVVSLERLVISGCHQLMSLIHNNEGVPIFSKQVCLLQPSMSSLQTLVISDIPKLAELPAELSELKNLKELEIRGSGMLKSFPDAGLPSGLVKLRIKECNALKSLPEGIARINTCLKELDISKCSSLVSFSFGGLPTALVKLRIEDCRQLELPLEREHCYTSIKELRLLNSCDSLKSLLLSSCPNIYDLCIEGCRNFETLSTNGLENPLQLEVVNILSCPKFVSFLVGGLPALSIQYLGFRNCPELECLPKAQNQIFIYNCQKLMACRKDWGLQKLPSPTCFIIGGEYEEDLWRTFPEEWLLPSSLSRLNICNCQNLKALNHNGLRHLTSLRDLTIFGCPHLESLPKEAMPSSIIELTIRNCPLLKPRCQKGKGEDWHKIAHIPFIMLDDDVI